jgi:hypothetical protein
MTNSMNTIDEQAEQLTRILCGELFQALGFSRDGSLARLLSPLVRKPILRFSRIAAGFDQQVNVNGFQAASRWILPNFAQDVDINTMPDVPHCGPLLVISNHPGAYDTLVLTANIPRDDIKIIVNIPLDFIQELPETQKHFLYAPRETYTRMKVVRQAIRHLKAGGALLLFASGGIDPDPAHMPGSEAAIQCWSRSLEIFTRLVPDTQVLISMVSGILTPKYIHHPLTHLRKLRPDKQRISEFLQVMNQMLRPGNYIQRPQVSFTMPFSGSRPHGFPEQPFSMEYLKDQARQLLKDHLNQPGG